MDNHDYSIDNLALNFVEHSIESDKILQKNIRRFKEDYPDNPLPNHYENSFNLSRALSVLTDEILDLKEKLNNHINFTHLNP